MLALSAWRVLTAETGANVTDVLGERGIMFHGVVDFGDSMHDTGVITVRKKFADFSVGHF